MAWTQAQIDEVKRQIAAGAKALRDGDQSWEGRSLNELFKTLEKMEADNGTRVRRTLARYSSGV